MSDPILVFRVVGWDRLYETTGTLKKPGPRAAVPAFTDLGEMKVQRLLDAPGGFEAFSAWNIIWRLAARCPRRGTLLEDGVPLTVQELARLARCAVEVMQQAVQTLCRPGIGLLEQVPLDEAALPDPIQRVERSASNSSSDRLAVPCSVKSTGERHAGASSADGALESPSNDVATLFQEVAEAQAACQMFSDQLATIRESRRQLAGCEITPENLQKQQREKHAQSAVMNVSPQLVAT